MNIPLFTRKDLKAASTKRPIDWPRIKTRVTAFNSALDDVLRGVSEERSRIDLATLFAFFMSCKRLGHIDDGGLIENSVEGLAKAYTRTDEGQPFRLDAVSAEALREMIATFETVAKGVSARDYMKICLDMPNHVKVAE